MYEVVCDVMEDSWEYCPAWYIDIREFSSYAAALRFFRTGDDYDIHPRYIYCGDRIVKTQLPAPMYQVIFDYLEKGDSQVWLETRSLTEAQNYLKQWDEPLKRLSDKVTAHIEVYTK